MSAFLRVTLLLGVCWLLLAHTARLAAPWGPAKGVVAFQRTTIEKDNDIYLLDVSTRVLFQRTRHPGNDRFPTWSPDGTQLVFQSFRPTQNPSDTLYIMPVFPSDAPARQLLPGWLVGAMPAWSPDGCCIAFSAYDNNTFSSNTHILHLPTEAIWNAVPTSGVSQFAPAWSPDSTQIAVSASGVDAFEDQEIYTVSVPTPPDGPAANPPQPPTLHQVTRGGGFVNPAWSPQGNRLAFTDAFSIRGPYNLYYATLPDAQTHNIPGPRAAGFPVFSPDGKWIVYSAQDRRDTNSRVLYISRIDGAQTSALTITRGRYVLDTAPAWR